MAEHLATAESALPPGEIEVLFARQPILDADGRLAGYELLYRGEGS
jgi:c-di-GMP phosphodiesterase